jgi:hypothetical protein
MVARADCGLAQTYLSRGAPQTGVERNDLYRSLYIQARGVLKKELLNTVGQAERSVVPGTPA